MHFLKKAMNGHIKRYSNCFSSCAISSQYLLLSSLKNSKRGEKENAKFTQNFRKFSL